ncbi:MAG: zf-TFIIB domain-containing protein, partial [Pseudomonadota bacterium]
MDCPYCGKEMKEEDFGGAGIDVCREGCRGLWFEAFELKKLDKQDGGQGRGLEAALREPLAPEG